MKVSAVLDGADPQEARVLAVYKEIRDQHGAQKAIDVLCTVLMNVAIQRLGGAATARQLREFADLAERLAPDNPDAIPEGGVNG